MGDALTSSGEVRLTERINKGERKLAELNQFLTGKPINGEPYDEDGGFCGRTTSDIKEMKDDIRKIKLVIEQVPTMAKLRNIVWLVCIGMGILIFVNSKYDIWLMQQHEAEVARKLMQQHEEERLWDKVPDTK